MTKHAVHNVVVDPVMVSTSGSLLMDPSQVILKRLIAIVIHTSLGLLRLMYLTCYSKASFNRTTQTTSSEDFLNEINIQFVQSARCTIVPLSCTVK